MKFSQLLTTDNLRQFWGMVKSSRKGPQVVAIELTNRCNAHCKMCPRDEVKRKHGDMDFELFKRTIDTSMDSGISVFQLSFFGESLLYHQLREAVEYIKGKDPNSVVVMNTNASILDKEKASELLEAGINSFRVSVEGNNAEEYAKVRIGMNYDRMRNNVKGLRQLIDEKGYNCSIIVQGLNVEGYPIDEKKYREDWEPYADQVGVRNDQETMSKTKEPFWNKLVPCPAILSQVIVMVDGRTTICAYDWKGDEAYEDISKNSLAKIWQSSKLKRYRLLHLMGLKKLIPICNSCQYRIGALGI